MWVQEDFDEEDFDEEESRHDIVDHDAGSVVYAHEVKPYTGNSDVNGLQASQASTFSIENIDAARNYREESDHHPQDKSVYGRLSISKRQWFVLIFLATLIASIVLIVVLTVRKNDNDDMSGKGSSGFGVKYMIPGSRCLDGNPMSLFQQVR